MYKYKQANEDLFFQDLIYNMFFLRFAKSDEGKAFIEKKVNDRNKFKKF